MHYKTIVWLTLITLLGLGLRLLAWQWREFYPLGGDEQEYLAVALTLLQERRYTELLFMRPPLYPIFLAASIYAVDSLVQNLRLVQALISTATIPLVYLLTRELTLLAHQPGSRAPLLAALLTALSYTLAINAAELLSETLFLSALTLTLWLLLWAGRSGGWWRIALAGIALAASCLIRSVALPLLPLGLIWLTWQAIARAQPVRWSRVIGAALGFVLAFSSVLLPWTARNYVTYGGVILIDTTGAENLWLDNDPAGREAVKAQLFALGEDRLARQQLASERGMAVIRDDPARFVQKMGRELKLLFALEYTDDLRARPAIWVPPAEVAARLLLGDALWLLILLVGSYGLAYAALSGGPLWRVALLIFLPWCAYIALTSLIFHVELRYRLPVFPALIPFAALALMRDSRQQTVDDRRQTAVGGRQTAVGGRLSHFLALLLPTLLLLITLLHVNYPALAWQLGTKHWHLSQAERALARGDVAAAQAAAQAAQTADPGRALAHVALARAALLQNDTATAERELTTATRAIPAHPHAHLLLADLRRAQGDFAAASAAFAQYETGSLEDLQTWLWERRVTPLPSRLELGAGLDLGFVRGMHAVGANEAGWRWTRERAQIIIAVPPGATELRLLADARRPDQAATALEVWINGVRSGQITVATRGGDYAVDLPPNLTGSSVVVELRNLTFTPRSFDPASPDGRRLGVAVQALWAE
jgi:4-amino-4-deoxy-L-arabinose transferase-like glycosyltransferase